MRFFAALVACLLAYSASASPSSTFVPDIAYQARHVFVAPPATAAKIARIEELVVLPAPAPLGVPVPVPVVAVEEHKDIWERIRRGFAMPALTGKLVEQQQAAILRRPEVLKNILQRSKRYLYHVVNELEQRGFPMELALLPMVESGYNPHALSSASALGLWQFIPATGKKYALAQTETYDGRRDIVASTRAAMDYLKFLHGLLGDWHLALASYNWGEESVMAAVERNRAGKRPTNYESISMPEETRLYVPKLQALRNIIANPEAFGIELEPVPNQPYFVTVDHTRPLDVKTAARLAEMPVNDFIALNPGYNGSLLTPGSGAVIVVPADKAETFRQNIANLPPAPRGRGIASRTEGAAAVRN